MNKNILSIILLVSITSLAVAYIAEYVFGYKPCILCLYERVVYMLTIILSLLSLMSKRSFLPVIFMVFIGSSILSFYHVGIEQHIFEETSRCKDELPAPTSIEQLRSQLETSRPSCASPEITFLSISFAGWNLILSIFMSIISFKGLRKCLRKNSQDYQEMLQENI